MIDQLSRLAIQHGTDKFGLHDYTPNYHQLFQHLCDKPIRLLEIGVGGYSDADRGGYSLATWRDYFPLGQIVGIDIQKKHIDLGPRVQVLQGSQIDPDFLAEVVRNHGPFDIIIDDGSHRNEHVVESYGILFPTLVAGGIYVAEDVQTAFVPRFGGSLTLDAPNSVGYFADIIGRLHSGDTDPLIADVAAMQRFHNMVALHKSDPGETAGSLSKQIENALFERVGRPLDNVLVCGIDLPGDNTLVTEANLPGAADQDMVVLSANCAVTTLHTAFARLRDTGILYLRGTPGPDMQTELHDKFVQVDHREIAVQFPNAAIDPIAAQVFAIVRHAAGVILFKAPNDYPSNFAFDADQPQAKAALAEMETVLNDSDTESGLAHFATILTSISGREAARPWLEKMAVLGATSRVYFQLASGLAQRDRRPADTEVIYRDALVHFPGDPLFGLGLATILSNQKRHDEARVVVETALAACPRDINLHMQMARIAEKQDDLGLAMDHAKQAIAMSTAARKPQAQTLLAELMSKSGKLDEAVQVLHDATALMTRFTPKAYRTLSTVQKLKGDIEAALVAADRAADLDPAQKEYRDWAASLRLTMA